MGLTYFETSAKDCTNVDHAFFEISKQISNSKLDSAKQHGSLSDSHASFRLKGDSNKTSSGQTKLSNCC